MFELVCAHAETHSGIVQSLLEPVMVELDSSQHELMSTQSGLIEHIGFRVEPFGDKSYLVRGVPQSYLRVIQPLASLRCWIEWLKEEVLKLGKCEQRIRLHAMALSEQGKS